MAGACPKRLEHSNEPGFLATAAGHGEGHRLEQVGAETIARDHGHAGSARHPKPEIAQWTLEIRGRGTAMRRHRCTRCGDFTIWLH
jgi:hypothetical protein